MDRRQFVAQCDTAALERRIDANVLEPAEAEQVRDRLADLRHRKRLPDLRFDDGRHRRLDDVAAFDEKADRSDRFADVVVDGGRAHPAHEEDR